MQLFNGKYATKTGATKGYLNYTDELYNTHSITSAKNTSPDCDYLTLVSASGYRFATFAWVVPCTGTQYSTILFSMTGVTKSDGTAVTIYDPNTCPSLDAGAGLTGAKPILMFYRAQNADLSKKNINATDLNSYWINAFPNITNNTTKSGVPLTADAATNRVSGRDLTTGNINGDNTSINTTYLNGTFNVNVNLIPALTPSQSGDKYYVYCRIGLPMDSSIGFSDITATFT